MNYEEIQTQLLATIKDYFKYTIQRPELLNRIGDNFIVFDFIREDAAAQILDLKLSAITKNLEHEKVSSCPFAMSTEIVCCTKRLLI